jgi:predicted RNase H-like HicB family nuclease
VNGSDVRHRYECRAFRSDPDGGYIAVCAAFPKLSAFGTTAAEALAELDTVLSAAVEVYGEEGWQLPHAGQGR